MDLKKKVRAGRANKETFLFLGGEVMTSVCQNRCC